MATFIGDYSCKVDVKGRIILPMAFKKQMPSAAADRFVVRRGIFDKCLVLYSMEEWNKELEKIRSRLNPYNKEHNEFMRIFFKGTAELELDSSNRLLIPKRMLELAGIEKDVVLLGKDRCIEIWAEEVYAQIDMPSDVFSNLAEKLLGDPAKDQG
jgi:MraZ protein